MVVWLEREFMEAGRIGRVEKSGYRFWGPVIAAIAVTELFGALADWLDRRTILHIAWPTFSSTVGHLETQSPALAVVVVGTIAFVAFEAVTSPTRRVVHGRAVYHRVRHPRPTRFYDWWVVLVIVVLGGFLSVAVFHWDKFAVGYTIYGLFLLFGIIVPGALAYFAGMYVSFPGLIYTVRKLERRLHWVAAAVITGLTILLVHLALYPWPDLVRESTSYAGLGRADAVAAAGKRIAVTLSFRSAERGEFRGRDAWLMMFEPAGGFGTGCVVAVRKDEGVTTVTPSAGCRG
jgi:hypothetical protein